MKIIFLIGISGKCILYRCMYKNLTYLGTYLLKYKKDKKYHYYKRVARYVYFFFFFTIFKLLIYNLYSLLHIKNNQITHSTIRHVLVDNKNNRRKPAARAGTFSIYFSRLDPKKNSRKERIACYHGRHMLSR